MQPRLPLIAAATALMLTAAACGDDTGSSSGSSAPSRTIEVSMIDIGFEPTTLRVSEGETVRFEFTNTGDLTHDAFIGSPADQMSHGRSMSGGGMHHGGDGDAVTVQPGKTKTMDYTFDEAGTTEIGCHQEGHYEAGMRIAVTVS